MNLRFNHKTAELGQSQELDALVAAAMRDSQKLNDEVPRLVWFNNYEDYEKMCKAIGVEPLAREEARRSSIVQFGETP